MKHSFHSSNLDKLCNALAGLGMALVPASGTVTASAGDVWCKTKNGPCVHSNPAVTCTGGFAGVAASSYTGFTGDPVLCSKTVTRTACGGAGISSSC